MDRSTEWCARGVCVGFHSTWYLINDLDDRRENIRFSDGLKTGRTANALEDRSRIEGEPEK